MIKYERTSGGVAAYDDGKLIGWILRTIHGWSFQLLGGSRNESDYGDMETAKKEFEKKYVQ